MEIHFYGLLLLLEHLKAVMKIRFNISPILHPINCFTPFIQLKLTCLWWERVRLCRWRKRSQSVQRLPHMLHSMMAAVSPSSWLSHMGCGWAQRDVNESFFWSYVNYFHTVKILAIYIILTICFCCPSLPIQRPEDSLSTWSWSSTHSDAKASHSYQAKQEIIYDYLISWMFFKNTDTRSYMRKSAFIPLW